MGLFDNKGLSQQVKDLEVINADLRQQLWEKGKEMIRIKEEFDARLLDYQKQLARARAAAVTAQSPTDAEDGARQDARLCEELTKRLEEMEMRLAELSQWERSHAERNALLEADVQHQQLAAIEAQAVAEDYRQEIERLHNQNTALADEVQILRQAVVSAKNERQSEERLQAELRISEQLRRALDAANAENSALQVELQRVSQELETERADVATRAASESTSALQLQISQLQGVLEDREAATEDIIAALEQEKEELVERITKLELQLSNSSGTTEEAPAVEPL